jgi:hypothetical protein
MMCLIDRLREEADLAENDHLPDTALLFASAADEIKRLREAGMALMRCSLPPHDVSGERMFEEAAQVFRNATVRGE